MEWHEILAQDERWAADPGWIETIEAKFSGTCDLVIEALKAYEWLQTTKGKHKKKPLRLFWLNWLNKPSLNHRPTTNSQESNKKSFLEDYKRRRDYPLGCGTAEDHLEAYRRLRGCNPWETVDRETGEIYEKNL